MAAQGTLKDVMRKDVMRKDVMRNDVMCNDVMHVALYARVSTHDQQTLPLQLEALREYAQRRNWQIEREVSEVASGAAATRRPKREALLQAAKRREVDAVLVWRLDRWGRSVADLVNSLAELEAVGVAFVSVTEALDLTTPAGRAMAAMVAVFAQFEREILKERIKAGIAQAKAQGKAMGRPKTAAKQAEEMRELHAQGISQAGIARRLGVGRTSVRRLLNSQDFNSQDLTLKGQDLTLKGQDLTLKGQDLTLKGQDLTLKGQDLTLKGQDLTLKGQDLTLKGQDLSVQETENP